MRRNWLKEQCEAASREISTWPAWKRTLADQWFEQTRRDQELTLERIRNGDNRKYGNF
jgi:hypothetical protein